jgi:hypothetical protein
MNRKEKPLFSTNIHNLFIERYATKHWRRGRQDGLLPTRIRNSADERAQATRSTGPLLPAPC